ncbi:hypothetical protein ACFX5U_10415 [Sphingobacterium sp. SG20118]|uniref:hypothetical protein n=1 Tax=Sphingobacterium sp. SG20118 TaxID=3367156 RepID=UPI0037DFBEA2
MYRSQVSFIFVAIFMLTMLSSCKFGRFVWYNFADIDDYKIFPKRELPPSTNPFTFYTANKELVPSNRTFNEIDMSYDDFLDQTKSVAFLVIRNDSILYERYFDDYDTASIVPSFSMAKSVTSMLIGCAIDDGLIGFCV